MATLKELLADSEQDIAFVAELTYRDPSTDVTSAVRITTGNWTGTGGVGYLRGLLDDPGDQLIDVEVDELGGIAVATLSPMRFLNTPPSMGAAGPLDFLRTKTLSDRSVKLLAGAPDAAISTFEELGTGFADGEPEWDEDAAVVTLRRKTALDRLQQDLDVDRYVGEPGALHTFTSGTMATTAYNAIFDRTHFSILLRYRVRVQGSTSAAIRLIEKISGGTNNNYRFRWDGDNRRFDFTYSVGGVSNAVNLVTPSGLALNAWHELGVSRSNQEIYLMLNGDVVATVATPGTPNLPAVGINLNVAGTGNGELNAPLILTGYIPPDEMRALFATRLTGGEQGLAGLWRADDATGSTLTDHSPTAAHATISGTESVNFDHVSSDLGEAGIAGQSMLATHGELWNAPADLVSAVFERWRFSDRAVTATYSLGVRDEGDSLDGGVDFFDNGDGTLALVSPAGEPLTIAIDRDDEDYGGHLRTLFGEILDIRGPITSSDFDSAPLYSLYATGGGLSTRRRPVAEIISEILRGTLGYAALRLDGRIAFDSLLSPVSPGPRGEPCVEIVSTFDSPSAVDWDTGGALVTGYNFTIALWVKLYRTGPNDTAFGDVMLTRLHDDTHVHEVRFNLDADAGVPRLELDFYDSGIRTAQRQVPVSIPSTAHGDATWWFLAVTNNTAANECKFYGAKQGAGAVQLLGTTTAINPGGATSEWNGLQVGGDDSPYDVYFRWFRGGVAEPQLWNGALSATTVGQLFTNTVGSTASRAFFAPLNGAGVVARTDVETSTVGIATGTVVERPDLTVDLRVTPRPIRRRSLVPAKSIVVRYARNWSPLDEKEIKPAVSASERAVLKEEWLELPWASGAINEDYEDARDIVIDSPWATKAGAETTMRLARRRWAPGHEFAVLGPTPDAPHRSALPLEIGAEVRVLGYQDLADPGQTYRVARNRRIYGELDAELYLWR